MKVMSGLLLLVVLLAAALASGEGPQGMRPEISVQAQIDVPDYKPVQIMDIANLSFLDPEIAKEALELEVMPAPLEGQTTTVKNSEMIKLLKVKMGQTQSLSEYRWMFYLPESIQVTAKKMPISYLAAENQIRQAMLKQCRSCNIKIRNLKIPNSREPIAYKDCSMQIENVKLSGSFLLPVACKSNTYWVSGTASITKSAAVAQRYISPGEHIGPTDFKMTEVDVTFAKDGLANEKDLMGQVAGRPLMLHQPIFKGDLKKEILITRGQSVRTVLGDPSFEIESQGIAEEPGSLGDVIKVKTADSQKVLGGVVVEKGVVKLQ